MTAPSVDQAQLGDLGAAYSSASQLQANAQNQINAAQAAWNYNQELPFNMLGQYQNYIGGGYGGSTTGQSTTPYYSNTGANILSGLTGGASIGASALTGLGALGLLGGGGSLGGAGCLRRSRIGARHMSGSIFSQLGLPDPTQQGQSQAYPYLGSPATDPNLQGLIGLAGGFARAAMPQPYKGGTPFGAALGMAAQGMGEGQQAANRAQYIKQQGIGSEIQNIGGASALPMEVARNKMLGNIYSNPDALQQLLGGSGALSAGAAPGIAPTNSIAGNEGTSGPPAHTVGFNPNDPRNAAALATVSDPALRSVITMAAQTQNVPLPELVAIGQQESGLNPNAPNGKAGEVGTFQVKPTTASMMGLDPASLATPYGNTLAAAKYLRRQIDASNGNVPAAIGGYNSGSVVNPNPGYTNDVLGIAGKWGPSPYAPPSSSGVPNGMDANSALATAQAYEQRANQVELAHGLGLPIAGDPASLRQAAQQYRDLALAGPKAAAVKNAELPATEAAQTHQAQAEAAASRTKLITTRAGVFDPVSGKEIYRQPEYHEVQDPNTGTEYPAMVQPGENGQLNIIGGPPGQNGALPPSKLAPGQEEMIKELAEKYGSEDKTKYEGATNALSQLDQQDQNIANLIKGGGWMTPGTGVAERLQWAKGINTAFTALGAQPRYDPGKVSSWEDAEKT